MLTPYDFGGVPDGVTDNAAAFNDMIVSGRHFFIPEGVWATSAVIRPFPGSVIDATRDTEILAIGSANVSGIVVRSDAGRIGHSVVVRNLKLNGNKANRTGPATGNGVFLWSSNCLFDGVEAFDWPNAGWLMGGKVVPCDFNSLRDCKARGNGGVGVSMHTVKGTHISGLVARDNGLENLTIDGLSVQCRVTGSHFGPANGGCGIVGWDGGHGTAFFGNVIDGEGSTAAPEGNRNGICVNGQFSETDDINITGNVILNCAEAGVLLRDRTATGGYAVGRALVAANVLRGNGADIVAETDIGLVQMGANIARIINA